MPMSTPDEDAIELLRIAQRLDGFLGLLGADHAIGYQIQDIPEKLRKIATAALLAKK